MIENLLLGFAIFLVGVYVTRWMFSIDKIVELLSDILKELRMSNEKKSDESDLDFETNTEIENSLRKGFPFNK